MLKKILLLLIVGVLPVYAQPQVWAWDDGTVPYVVTPMEIVERMLRQAEVKKDETLRHIPVVILTSSKEDEDLLQAYKLGTNAYVRKPVDFLQFTNAVKQLGMFWLLLNESPVCTCNK